MDGRRQLLAAAVLILRKPRDLLGFAYFHPVNVIAPGWLLRTLNPGMTSLAGAGGWERGDKMTP